MSLRVYEPPAFSKIERSVIHLSRKDPVASIADLHDWRISVARFFAGSRAGPLANERLEVLRRFSILVRIYDDPGDDALDRFLDAGYNVEQARFIHAMVDGGKPAGRHNELELAFRIVPLGISAVQDDIGKMAISLAIGGFISVIVASFLSLR